MLLTAGGVRSTGADPDEEEDGSPNPRQDEIQKYNSSIHVESGKRVFSYYWQVNNIYFFVDIMARYHADF